MTPRSDSRARLGFLLALALAFVALVIRSRYGIEWFGDEANALAEPMRYAMGDLPIIDSWHTQFSSGLLLTPLLWLLRTVVGTGDGLVVGFRLAYVVMQAGVALGVWSMLRRSVSSRAAGAVALAAMFYAPYFYVFPYYNNIAVAALLVAIVALYTAFTAEEGAGAGLLGVAGVALAVAVIAYPTMLAVGVFMALGVAGYARSRRTPIGGAVRSVSVALAVTGGLLALYGIIVLALAYRSGHLAASLPHFLHPIDRDMSLGALVARFLRTKAVIGAALASATVLGAGLVAVRRTRLSAEAVASAAVLTACAFALVAPWAPHTLLYYMDIQQAAMLGVALVVPALALVRRDASLSAVLWLITVPTVGAALATAVVSYEGFETATMPTVIGAVGTLIVLFRWSADSGSAATGGRVGRAAWLATASVFVLLASTTLLLTGGDSPVWRLSTTIGSGPYSSVHTTAEGAARHDAYMRLFGPLGSQGGRIAFVGEFPVGYVLTGLRPGTYSVWTTFPEGALWREYLDITGNVPATIVATRFVGPNGGRVAVPYAPPFGLDGFDARYRETYRDDEFVVYRQRTAP